MGKRFDILLFPGGTSKAFTLSYDDGVVQDRRLVEIFNKYNVKCTFNLGYGVLGYKGDPKFPIDISRVETSEVKELYKGHEVGGHRLYHSDVSSLGAPYSMYEILEDKAQLEKLVGYPLKMFAYPFGFFNEKTKEYLKIAGYKGARTIKSTFSFDLPEDPYELNPTCHHNDEKLMELGTGTARLGMQEGDTENGSIMVGESLNVLNEVLPCKDVVEIIIADAKAALAKAAHIEL